MNAETLESGKRSHAGVPAGALPAREESWELRPAVAADVEPIAELRATVMRPDLERLGRYDDHRVRQRLRDAFSPRHTSIVVVGSELVGCVAVRPAEDHQWLEHFYLDPRHQGRGLGSAVLRAVSRRADTHGATLRLNVLRGSAARRLYERHGFVAYSEDPVDVFMVRRPSAGADGRRGDSSGGATPPAGKPLHAGGNHR